MDNNYIDYLSTLPQEEAGDTLKDLMRDNYEFFKHYIDELFHVEANYIYLNLVCGVSQTRIAEIIGVSQYGVSKRIASGLNKLSYLLKIPEKSKQVVKEDLYELLPLFEADVTFNYYFMKTYALTGRVMVIDANLVNNIIFNSLQMLDKLAKSNTLTEFISNYLKNHRINIGSIRDLELRYPDIYKKIVHFRDQPEELETNTLKASRYHTYIKGLIKVASYGDYTFKMYDKERIC